MVFRGPVTAQAPIKVLMLRSLEFGYQRLSVGTWRVVRPSKRSANDSRSLRQSS